MSASAIFVLVGLGLQVRGTTDCPKLDDVRARLSEMVTFSDELRLEERALVERRDSIVRVALESADGRVIGERELAVDAPCEELAQVVAVVLAAWLGDAHPELVARLPPALTAPSGPQSATEDATPAVPTSSKLPPRAPAPKASEPLPASENVPRKERRLASAAALGASVGRFGAVPSAQVGLAWIGPDSGFGLGLSLGVSGAREQVLGGGVVRWSRWPLSVGLLLRSATERAALEVQAGPAVAWLRLAGEGFAETASYQDLSYGGFAALRVGWRATALEPFIAVSSYLWLRRATAFVSGDAPRELNLPIAEMWVLAGVAVDPFALRRP